MKSLRIFEILDCDDQILSVINVYLVVIISMIFFVVFDRPAILKKCNGHISIVINYKHIMDRKKHNVT